MYNYIAYQHCNNKISVISIFNVKAYPQTIHLPPHLNRNLLNEIQNGTAFATCDTSVKNGKMEAYWVLMN